MNDFSLQYDFNSSEFVAAQRVLWEYRQLPLLKNLRVYYAYILGALMFGGFDWFIEREWNFFLTLAFLLVAIVGLSFYDIHKKKKLIHKALKEESLRFQKKSLKFNFEFTDKQLMYTDNEKTINMDWSLFGSYVLYKGYLILGHNSGVLIQHIFKIEEDNPDYLKISNFIDQKLDQRLL